MKQFFAIWILILIGAGMQSLLHILTSPRVSLAQMVEEMKELPEPPYPVRVEIASLEEIDSYGACSLEEKTGFYPGRTIGGPHYVIEIDETCSADLASFILVHEWAHTLAWEDEVRDGDHSTAWGEAYARCYLAMFPED